MNKMRKLVRDSRHEMSQPFHSSCRRIRNKESSSEDNSDNDNEVDNASENSEISCYSNRNNFFHYHGNYQRLVGRKHSQDNYKYQSSNKRKRFDDDCTGPSYYTMKDFINIYNDQFGGCNSRKLLESKIGLIHSYENLKIDLLTSLGQDGSTSRLYKLINQAISPHKQYCQEMKDLPLEFWERNDECKAAKSAHMARVDRLMNRGNNKVLDTSFY